MASAPQPNPDPNFDRNAQRTSSFPAVIGKLAVHEDVSGRNFTEEGRVQAKLRFLEAFARDGTIRSGCRAAGINRTTYYRWVEGDEGFREGLSMASEEYEDSIREAIQKRAIEGVVREKRAYYKGDLVDVQVEREYSDTLLAGMAKAKLPEYKAGVDAGGEGKIPLEVALAMAAALGNQGIPSDGVVGGSGDLKKEREREDANARTSAREKQRKQDPIDVSEYKFKDE